MAIKFGDTLENQNTNFPIVDVVGDNVAGVHVVEDFANDHLIAIPSNARRTGSIVVAQDTGKVFIFKGTGGSISGNNNSGNEWGHPAGTNWVPAGSTTLGTPTDGSLTDGNPAIGTFTASTTIVDAIDALNETLGALVPTAPASLATQINAGVEFGSSSFGAFTTFSSNRLVSNPVLNSLSGAPSTGDVVNHTTATSISNKTITVASANDCAVEAAQLVLSGSQSATVNLAAGSTSATTTGLTLSKTTGGFPTTGDSANFYTGISSFTYGYSGTALGTGMHKIALGDADSNPAVTKIFFVQPTSSPSAIDASSTSLDTSTMNEDGGAAFYFSSGVKYTGNTNFSFGITATVNNIVPSGVSVYGAIINNTSNFNWAVGEARGCFAAPPTLQYTAHQSVSSNTNVAAGLAAYSLSEDCSLASVNGQFTIGTGTSRPRYDFKSMYGNDNNIDFANGNTKTLLCWNNRTTSSSSMIPYEEALYSDVNGNGVRVKETSSNSYTSTPGGTAANFGSWSPQFGNNASSSFAVNDKDAIVTPDGIVHDDTSNFSTIDYPASQATATNFSNRNTDPQFITWKVPLNTSNPAQKLDITVTGTFNEFKVKQFDTGETNSTFDANPTTNGWLDCMAVNSTQTNGGVPIGGCGDGAFFDGSESNTTLRITAGTGRWGNGSHLYIRIKLNNGQAITKLGVENI
jgi:hypothetical protein